MFNKKTIRDIDVDNKRVLVRVDFNVPIEEGAVADDTRIKAALPTIEYLLKQDAAVILCSHLGRPKGEKKPNLSLRPVAKRLSELINLDVEFVDECIGNKAERASENLDPGQVLLLENTRFHPGEKENDHKMARQLANLAEVFVNDAFGTAHRSHASNVGVAQYLPSAAGFLLEKEIQYLGEAIKNPERPFIAILGGAKVSDKIGVIRNLLNIADQVLIGGGMANTFFKATGYTVGDSLVEDEVLETARQIVKEQGPNEKLRLPVDVVIADRFDTDAERKVISVGPIPDGWRIMDIGPETVEKFSKVIESASTVVWNGPMGVFELEHFAQGTYGIARAVADSQSKSIIGGGDSVSAVNRASVGDQITHVSTGGGASLEMLEGKVLPGLDTLEDRD